MLAVRLPFTDDPSLRRLELASLLWNAGEQVYLVGLIVTAFRLGGPAAVALLGVLQAAPAVALLQAVLGMMARVRSERLLAVMVAVRAIAIGTAATALAVAGPDWIVFAAAAIDAVAASIVRPTRAALAPRLARSTEELVTSNLSIATGRSFASLFGPGLAAILIASQGVAATLGVGTLLLTVAFLVSAGIRAAAPLPPLKNRPRAATVGAITTLRRLPAARAIATLIVVQQLVRGMLPVLFVSLAVGPLAIGDSGVGLLNAAAGAGALAGTGLALGVTGRLGLGTAFGAGIALWGAGLMLSGLFPTLLVALAGLIAGGVGRSVLEATGVTLLQRTVPVRERPRVFGALEVGASTAVAVGALLAAWLVQALGPATTAVAAGGLPLLLVLVSWPTVRSARAMTAVAETQIRRLRTVPMLQPLALCTTEELASEVRTLEVAAGVDIVRQGEAGDSFYLVESGELQVVVDGRLVRTMTTGDSFGEIALIRDIPRTATVQSVSPATLTVIDRDHFLAAVTGRRDAAAAAEEVIRGHLGA